MSEHLPFALILDEKPVEGHLFGALKHEIAKGQWVTIEVRCRLCNKLPIELLTIDWGIIRCKGLFVK